MIFTYVKKKRSTEKPTAQEAQRNENMSRIFSSIQSKEKYVANLKSLYTTFDQLSNQIINQNAPLGLSSDEQKAVDNLSAIKTDLFNELSKFEKITEEDLQEKNPTKNNVIGNLSDDNVKNLQLYLDEASFIISNLTEALDYDEKINHLKRIKDVFKEMTESENDLEFSRTFTDTLKNIVPLPEIKKNRTKANHDINQELDRMLSQILKEQEQCLSLLVSNKILNLGNESKLFNDPTNEIDQKINNHQDAQKLHAAKQRYIELHQQEYKLRLIQENPDKYIKTKSVNNIKDLRKDIITARRNASAIQKESDALGKLQWATGFFEKIFNRIWYGSEKIISNKIAVLENKKQIFDESAANFINIYQDTNKKRISNSQIYNAIRTNSPDKLKSLIPNIDPAQLYNKVMEQKKAAQNQAPKKESWVGRILSGLGSSKGKGAVRKQ